MQSVTKYFTVTKCNNSSSPLAETQLPVSVSGSAIMLFQRWQLRKVLPLSRVHVSISRSEPLKPITLSPPQLRLCVSCVHVSLCNCVYCAYNIIVGALFLQHSLTHCTGGPSLQQLWENPPIWESEVNTCEKPHSGEISDVVFWIIMMLFVQLHALSWWTCSSNAKLNKTLTLVFPTFVISFLGYSLPLQFAPTTIKNGKSCPNYM